MTWSDALTDAAALCGLAVTGLLIVTLRRHRSESDLDGWSSVPAANRRLIVCVTLAMAASAGLVAGSYLAAAHLWGARAGAVAAIGVAVLTLAGGFVVVGVAVRREARADREDRDSNVPSDTRPGGAS